MDKMQKLFEGIDAKILTNETKKAILEEFEKLVNEKSEIKAEELFKGKEEEYSKALDEMIETATKTIQVDAEEKFNEAVKTESERISEAYAESLKIEAENALQEEVDSLAEKFNKYIEYTAQAFIDENEAKWVQETEVKKSDKIQEAFVKFASNFGLDLKAITESRTDESVELEKAIEGNIKLQEEIKELKKEKMLDEASKDLTAPSKDKLKKLMEEVKFESEDQFGKKLELYKSAIDEKSKKVYEEDDRNKQKSSYKPSWK